MSQPRNDQENTVETTPVRDGSSWVAVFFGALFVIVVVAAFSYFVSEDGARKDAEPAGAFLDSFIDSFDRPADGAALGDQWSSVRGGWGIQLGVAYLPRPDPTLNLALVDVGAREVSIAATVSGNGLCGVVARYEDERNFVALVRVQEFGVWNLLEVADGVERRIDTVMDIPFTAVGVALEAGDDIVAGAVAFNRVTVVTSPSPAGSSVGLVAMGGEMGACTWDDVVVRRAR
jgi:hypothetical protein